MFWKEISVDPAHQIPMTRSLSETEEVIRVTKVWHLPYYSDAGAYDDEEDGNENEFRQEMVEITHPEPTSDVRDEWFAGDIVPF